MKLKVVAITGADDSIKPEALCEISKEYPFVEWAILLSKNQMGSKRFPSKQWMQEMSVVGKDLRFAGHLCGSWLRNLMANGDLSFASEIPLWDQFKRIQLNFHGEPQKITPELLKTLRDESWKNSREFIIQMDGINNGLCHQLLWSGVMTMGLYDVSHGAGVLPDEWPETIPGINPNAFRGLAGGLGPNNIKDELIKMEKAVKDDVIWIDMETKIRSNNDMQFDLDKVRLCLEAAKPYVKD